MADAIPMLRREQRRHLLMNGWLIAGFIIVGTAVTNERGIFRPVDTDGLSAMARAFISMASPIGGLGPQLRDVRSVSALDPFEVTGPSNDVRRRLIDAIDYEPGDPAQAPLGFNPPGDPTNVASIGSPDAVPGAPPPAFNVPPQILNPAPVPAPDIPQPGLDTGVVPEPATWAMLILGFGIMGGSLRAVDLRRRTLVPQLLVRRRRGRRADGIA